MGAEELLKRLLEHFFVSVSEGGLEWRYVEGVTIREIADDKFELALLPFLGEEQAAELKKVHGV